MPAAGAGDQEQTPDEEALDLLGTLGSSLSKLHQAALGAKTSSPLLSSPTKDRPNAAAGSSNDQESAGSEHEEEAVKAFIKQLPAQGVSRPDLATLLLSMLGSSSGATQLSTAARLQLLQVAHFVEHDDMALSPVQCLVLGELFADAAVAAARVSPHPGSVQLAAAGTSTSAAAQAGRGSTPTAPNMRQSSGLVKRSARARGRLTELALEQLQQSCQLWLSRYRLAVAEAVVSPSEGLMMGQARYWWATGRLLESSGEMSAASTAYSCCKDSLTELGGCHACEGSALPRQYWTTLALVWFCEVAFAAFQCQQCTFYQQRYLVFATFLQSGIPYLCHTVRQTQASARSQ